MIDIELVSIQPAARLHCAGHNRLDRGLLHIGHHLDHDVPIPLEQPEDRRLLLVQRAPTPRALQAPPPAFSPEFSHDFGVPFVSGHHVHFVRFHFAAQFAGFFFTTTPSRNWLVIAWASPGARSSSAAIWLFDKFKPIKYRHSTHTFKG